MRRPARVLCALFMICAGPIGAEEPGYSFQSNQIRVDTRAHWRAWKVSVGAAAITPQGVVSPRYLRKRTNAALDAPDYGANVPGGVAAGSNEEDARFVIDGDPDTAWGPDLDASPEAWWLQLRLGRVVVVDSLVLHFVAEEKGEPFLRFDVLGWRRPPPLSPSKYNILGTDVSRLWLLFRTDRPTTTQRRFTVRPRPTERASIGFAGDPLEVIHILVTDSALDRMREVGEGTYADLLAQARGAVEYYRLGGGGRQTLTTRESYEQLPAERRGRIRYFQRERPRLAEVEVWTVGDNLNLGLVSSGALTTIETRREPVNIAATVTDGDISTDPSTPIFRNEVNTFFEDLGTLFWLEDMHFLTDARGPVDEFAVDVSDGSRAPDGSILWRRVAEERREALYRTFGIPPTRVRFLRAQFLTRSSAQMSMLEVLLYGEGYVAEAVLTSDIIELGGRKGLVSLEWEADTPQGTWVEISTRTGNGLDEVKVYHDSDGRVVTEERYRRRLPSVKRGEVQTLLVPGSDWSEWSKSYAYSGEEIKSPRIRTYLQLQARVLADTSSKDGPPAALRAIRVNMADLYADSLTAEVWPTRVQRVGVPEARSLYIRPRFSHDLQGFDEIRVAGTPATQMELVEVRSGTDDGFRAGSFDRVPAARITLLPAGKDTLVLRLPALVRQGTQLVEVRLRHTVFGNSAALEGAVRASGQVGAWEIANVGDATDAVDSQTNVVLALADHDVLTDLRIAPAVVTPNGDGANDEARIAYDLFEATGGVPVRVEVLDVSGRCVRTLHAAVEGIGQYERVWDGRNAAGDLVPPGIYLYRVVARVTGRDQAHAGPVCVAY
ncbi:MAG: FlgD immunoglobulin-like domain containing protein [Candidatus Latescibacterota bacterium]